MKMTAHDFIVKYGLDGLKKSIDGNIEGFVARGNDFCAVEDIIQVLSSGGFSDFDILGEPNFGAKEGEIFTFVDIEGAVFKVVMVEFSGQRDDYLCPVVKGFSNFTDRLEEIYLEGLAKEVDVYYD